VRSALTITKIAVVTPNTNPASLLISCAGVARGRNRLGCGSPALAWPIPQSPAWIVTAGASTESASKIVLLMGA